MASATFLNAGANVSATVARMSRQALGSSTSMMMDIWCGVDLLNVNAEQVAFQAVSSSRDTMLEHWSTPEVLEGLPPPVARAMRRCASGSASGTAVAEKHLTANSSFLQIECRSRELLNGQLGLAALVAVVRYELQWANPVWDIA